MLYSIVRWRKTCVHLGGMAFFFHFVSVVEMLVQAHRWMPVGVREIESLLGFAVAGLFFLVWWLYDAISLGIFALPATFFLVFIPALGPDRYTFPSKGFGPAGLWRTLLPCCWPMRPFASACWLRCSTWSRSAALRAKPRAGAGLLVGAADWLPPLDTLERIALATLEFGFPCMTVGLIIGSVLAQETPLGAAYFRDPKVLLPSRCGPSMFCCCWSGAAPGCGAAKPPMSPAPSLVVMMAVWAANLFSHVHRFGPQ